MLRILFSFLLFALAQNTYASAVKSCNAELTKCYVDPMNAKKGDIVLIFGKTGNHIVAKAKVIKHSKTYTELSIFKRKDEKNISSGFTVIKMRNDSHDIWTTTTPNI